MGVCKKKPPKIPEKLKKNTRKSPILGISRLFRAFRELADPQNLKDIILSACAPPGAAKTCAVRPGFARVVGELRAADPSNVQGPVEQKASPGEQSEAPRRRWKPGQEQSPGPENQDSTCFRDGETTIKIKFSLSEGGGLGGREENHPKFFFCGKRHDNKISKVQILWSRNFVVIAQAPNAGATQGVFP